VKDEIKKLKALIEYISNIPDDINAFITSLTNEMSALQL
jgi:hypothetical protein